MNKIKTVKIKNDDGTVNQESYSISADARNIDMTNGYNVQETIGIIDINEDGSIAEQLNDININIKKKTYYYNNVADMKADTTLKIGDMAVTLGYYNANDGGGATYVIADTSSLTEYQKTLDNSLYATLIVKNNTVNVKQCGAYGDGEHDDRAILQDCLNKFIKVILNKGTYLVSDEIIINNHNELIGVNQNECIIKAIPSKSFNIIRNEDTYYTKISDLTIDGNIPIGASVVNTDYAINGIYFNYTTTKDGFNEIKNIEIKNCSNAGILVEKQKESMFNNIVIHNCGIGLDNSSTDCKYFNITSYWNGIANINGTPTDGTGIYFRQNSNSNKIVNCKAHSNHGYGLYCRGSYDNYVNFEAQDNHKHGIYMYNCSNNNFNSITSSTNSQENNTYNEIYMAGVHECYLQGNVVTRNVNWTEYFAQAQIKMTENCYNNKLDMYYTLNTSKLSTPFDMTNPTCYNDIKINNMIYGIKNILNEDILSDSNNGNGISNVFDSKNVDTNAGTLQINKTKGCQSINYATSQKTSPNGWLGVSVMIENGFQVGDHINAIANFINNNTTDLTCCIEARFYDSSDNDLSNQRQWSGNTQIKLDKEIPADTAKIKLSFLVLANALNKEGIVDLYSFRAGIIAYQ